MGVHKHQTHQAQPMHKRLIGTKPLQGLVRLEVVLKEQWGKRWAITRLRQSSLCGPGLQGRLKQRRGSPERGYRVQSQKPCPPLFFNHRRVEGNRSLGRCSPVHAVVLLRTLKESVPGFRKMTGLRPLLVNNTIGCDQSALSMRFRAGLACAEFTLLAGSGPTSRTTDSEYPLGAN